MPYFDEIVQLEIIGVGRIVGPKLLTLKGGSIAFWVETVNRKGMIDISISSVHFGKQRLSITVQ